MDHRQNSKKIEKFEHIKGRVSRWQISFDAVLDDPLGLVAFKTFLRKEYSDENLTFWIDCNDLEKLTESEEVNEKVNFIISKYIRYYIILISQGDSINVLFSPKCECPINLPSELIKSGVQAGECPRSDSFVRQKDHICHLMKTDSYPRLDFHTLDPLRLSDSLQQQPIKIMHLDS